MIRRSRWKCIVALGVPGGAGGEPEQRHVVGGGVRRLERVGLAHRHAVELAVEPRGAVEADDAREVLARRRARAHLVEQPRVAQREAHARLVDDRRQLDGAQHRHRVDDHGAGLRRREPAGDHGRRVRRAHEDAVAGHDAEVLDQHPGDAVGPRGQLRVGARAAVADQRRAVAEAPRHHRVGQLDADVQPLRVGVRAELDPGPLPARRQRVPGEGVDVARSRQRRVRGVRRRRGPLARTAHAALRPARRASCAAPGAYGAGHGWRASPIAAAWRFVQYGSTRCGRARPTRSARPASRIELA